jgi:hypothetical protein
VPSVPSVPSVPGAAGYGWCGFSAAQDTRGLVDHGREVVDVGREPRRGDGVEHRVGERQRGGVAPQQALARQGVAAGQAQLVGRVVEADDGAPARPDRREACSSHQAARPS